MTNQMHSVEFDMPDGSTIFVPVGPVSRTNPPIVPVPASDIAVGPLIATFDFVNDPTAFAKVSHSWFGGGVMNNIATDPANVVQTALGIELWLRNGKGALINSNPSDAAKPGFAFGAGYLEFNATFVQAEGTQPSINYHGSGGANNGSPVAGNWLGAAHAFAINRQATKADVYYDKTLERSFPITDADALHYFVANVGKNGWSAVWDTGQSWPGTGEDDDAEDYGPAGTAPDGCYLTIHSIHAWGPA